MSFGRASVVVFSLGLVIGGSVAPAQPLPLPRIVPAEPETVVPGPNPPLVVYRVSQYDVWQHLAVDRQGRFRPRVLLTPYGAYYSYNGQPYPWIMSDSRIRMPYASD